MSQAASQAAAFYRQSVENDADWTVRDEAGYPAPENREGRRAQPFWSSRPRVERIIETVPAYSGFEPEEIPLADFMEEWLPDLERDGVLIGQLERADRDRLRRARDVAEAVRAVAGGSR